MSLEGKRAVITGASRGIGAAVARALDAEGVRTVLVGRFTPPLAALCDELRFASPVTADLREPNVPGRIAEVAPSLLGGPIDVLVSNAGIFLMASIAATDDGVLDETLQLNLAAPFRLFRALLPLMLVRRTGHIVTIGSVADRTVFPENAAYAASKFGGRALHEATRGETRGTGVRATLVSPGPTDTAAWDPYDPDHRPGLTPRARMLRPEAVASAVVWTLAQPAEVNVDELRLSSS